MFFQPTDQVLTATNELNKQGMMKNVFETALDLSFSRNIPGCNDFDSILELRNA